MAALYGMLLLSPRQYCNQTWFPQLLLGHNPSTGLLPSSEPRHQLTGQAGVQDLKALHAMWRVRPPVSLNAPSLPPPDCTQRTSWTVSAALLIAGQHASRTRGGSYCLIRRDGQPKLPTSGRPGTLVVKRNKRLELFMAHSGMPKRGSAGQMSSVRRATSLTLIK